MSKQKWHTVGKGTSRGGFGKLPGGGSNGKRQGGNRHGGGYDRRRGRCGKIYPLTLQEGSVNGRRGLVGTVGGKRVEVWKPKYIFNGYKNLGFERLTIPAKEIVTRTGSFLKPIFVAGVPPGFQGHVHFFTSMNRGTSFTAILKDFRGGLQLAYVVRGQFQSKWTPVPARQTLPTRPTRKDSQETKKLGFATSNSFATLKPKMKVKPKKVKPKKEHFPPLGNNPATSTCNLAWGGNTRTLVKQVEDAKLAALVARMEKAKVAKLAAKKAALANTETDPRDRRIQIFNEDDPRGRRIQIFEEGVDEDFGYEEFDDDEYDDEYPEDEYPEDEYDN